jgi:ribonucleoside-triphosphate reductase
MQILKKDGRWEEYDFSKIKEAVSKSAARVSIDLTDEQWAKLERTLNFVEPTLSVAEVHNRVETALDSVEPRVAESYRNYRNYKKDFVHMMDSVLKSADELNYKIDR